MNNDTLNPIADEIKNAELALGAYYHAANKDKRKLNEREYDLVRAFKDKIERLERREEVLRVYPNMAEEPK